jgi:hypothetical protein
MDSDQTNSLLYLLERIAVALEHQNAVTHALAEVVEGVANRIEDLDVTVGCLGDAI